MNVLICDDHAFVREALAGTVGGRWPEARIALAADFPEAWAQARSRPDLCLADLAMPGADERDGIAGLCAAAPDMRIVVITGSHDDRLLLDLLDRGVAGFVPKTANGAIILAAIELVLAGGRFIPDRVAMLASPRRDVAKAVANDRGPLTARQIAVLQLVATGASNKDIARRLGLSPATIKTHLSNAIAILGSANRTEAAMNAKALGLL